LIWLKYTFQQVWQASLLIGVAFGAVLFLIIIPLLSLYPSQLGVLGPYLVFCLSLICLMIGQPSLFQEDYQDGTLEWLFVHHQSLIGYTLKKYSLGYLSLTLALLSITFIFSLTVSSPILVPLLGIQALTLAAMMGLHMLISGLLLQIRSWRAALQLLILIPMAVPFILLSYSVLESTQFSLSQYESWFLLASMSLIMVVIALGLTPIALKEALSH
jgi:heme exporter protein B